MKVLHIIDSMGLGGAQTVVKGIFEYQKKNNEIFLFSLRRKKTETKVEHKNVIIFDSYKKYSLKSLFALRIFVRENQIDILHCHLFRANIFGYLLKFFWFPKIKLIIHEHGGIVEDGLIYTKFIKFTSSRTNCYIAVSEFIKSKLIAEGASKNKIKLIYNYVDVNKFNAKIINWDIVNERVKIGLTNQDYVIGFAGRVIKRKGWREFIYAAEVVINMNPNAKFVIAGDGVEIKEMLNLIVELHLQKNVFYLGRIENMIWFYSLIDCLVLPSHWEGLPMIQLEVLSMNIPVITSDGPGLNEIINKNLNSNFYFKVGDINDLGIKINNQIKKRNFITGLDINLYNLDSYLINLQNCYENV